MEQLRMIYDGVAPEARTPRTIRGFSVRTLLRNEWEAYRRLRLACGFDLWKDENIEAFYKEHAIKDGIIVAVNDATGELVASATAEYGELEDAPVPATLGWVMTSAQYGGKGLGRAVSAAATRALVDANLKPIYLLTDDFRVPAVALYLKMGWKPWLFQDDMPGRWSALCSQLGYRDGWLEENSITDIEPFLK